ncbi:MAG: hypothetical protein J2P27_01070 [Actinobacteria bacterium]|nr:hypothetical protein [Actinomycetota bacterium]
MPPEHDGWPDRDLLAALEEANRREARDIAAALEAAWECECTPAEVEAALRDLAPATPAASAAGAAKEGNIA